MALMFFSLVQFALFVMTSDDVYFDLVLIYGGGFEKGYIACEQ